MSLQSTSQLHQSMGKHLVLACSLTVALMFLSACDSAKEPIDPDEPNDPSCMEMGSSPSEVCQGVDLTLASEAECAEAECQTITYETTCSGSLEALCLIQDNLCDEEPPDPNSICEAEGQVLATQEECAELECQEVSYPSACGQMGRTLCRIPDMVCDEEGYPDPGSICEQEGLIETTEEECAEVECQRLEFEVACGEIAEVICRPPGITEPLPTLCADRDESQCGLDNACQWLIPEPWACADPEEILPNAGCFPIMGCREDADCGEGEECQSVAFGTCDEPGDVCDACAEYQSLCLPVVPEPLPEKCADRDETQCGADEACRWLIPEPWACADPEEILPNAGCFSVMWCGGDADCNEGEQCRSVAFGACDEPGDACAACATYENICLPAGEQE